MTDQSVTLYPGDTLTVTAATGQVAEPTPPAPIIPPTPDPTPDPAVVAADAAATAAVAADPTPADSAAGVVEGPTSLPGVGPA